MTPTQRAKQELIIAARVFEQLAIRHDAEAEKQATLASIMLARDGVPAKVPKRTEPHSTLMERSNACYEAARGLTEE